MPLYTIKYFRWVLMSERWPATGMTRYSTSRDILYSAPPAAPTAAETEEDATAADATGNEPAAADD